MKKVTKAQLVKVAKEINKEWKMDPALLVKGTVAELEANQIAEVLPDLKPEDTFTPETQAVIDYLKANAAPVEKEEVEETAKEKKAREKAEKKAAKEAEEQAPEETAKEKKAREKAEKAAAKETKKTPKEEAGTLAVQVKGEMKKGTLVDFVNNQDEFKKHKKGLLGMKNHLAMRKQMSLILEGEKPNFEEVKKEKKEKVINPLIAEVNGIEKKKELKAFCKEHEEFAGLKVKSFEEADELKAAMIAILAPAKGPKVKKGKGVIAMIRNAVKDAAKKKGISTDDILSLLIAEFPNREPDSMRKTIRAQLPKRTTNETDMTVIKMENGNFRVK